MASIFARIIDREIPGHIVAEDSENIAFLDIAPLVTGHTLVVPKLEVDYIFDLEDEPFSKLQLFSKLVALSIKDVIKCERVGVAVMGMEVPHAHIHLIPIDSMDDMNFGNPKLHPTYEELALTAGQIARAFKLRF